MLDINTSEFKKWWYSSYPSLNISPNSEQMTLICHDKNNISISGWRINIKSRLYEEANVNDVKKGMLLISKKLEEKGTSFTDLFKPIFQTLIIDFNKIQKINNGKFYFTIPFSSKSFNLAIISLIQLFYWYYKLSELPSFYIKEKEIFEKLLGLIKRRNENNDVNMELQLEKFRDDIDDCISELMFAGLILNFNMEVSFKDEHDFMLQNIPCEVKTIHDEIVLGKEQNNNIVPMSKKEDFGHLSLKDEIIEQILRNKYKKDIKEAIEQGGKIVFINASFSTVAHDILSMDFMNNIDGNKKFKEILLKLIDIGPSPEIKNIPVIVGIGAVSSVKNEFVWYQTYFTFTVPVIIDSKQQLHLDENNYNNYIKNNLKFDDILINKTVYKK
jgi:hypothetical protein